MIPMKYEFDYIVVDRDEWIDDRTDAESSDEVQAAYDHFNDEVLGDRLASDRPAVVTVGAHSFETYTYQSERVLQWLKTLNATGIYGDGGPVQVCSYNEENFLSDDIIMTFANTEQFGPLFIWQAGVFTDSTVHVLVFNGDDDADAFSWASGYANCSNGDACGMEWIIESAYALWPNGGGESYKIGELTKNDDGEPLCPHDGGTLTFWAG